jgi:hypothetical protein
VPSSRKYSAIGVLFAERWIILWSLSVVVVPWRPCRPACGGRGFGIRAWSSAGSSGTAASCPVWSLAGRLRERAGGLALPEGFLVGDECEWQGLVAAGAFAACAALSRCRARDGVDGIGGWDEVLTGVQGD